MSKNLSAKYYQENKERQQDGRKRYKNLSEDQNESLLSIEKNIE